MNSIESFNKTSEATGADDRWHKIINWEVLRSIGSSPLATISILMPFVGYAILYNEQIVNLLSQAGFGLNPPVNSVDSSGATPVSGANNLFKFFDLEMMSKLNFLYVGSFLVGIGTIVFRLFAPKTVQQYKSIEMFFNSELDRASARRLRTMTYTIMQRRPVVAERLINVAPWLDRQGTTLRLAYAEIRELSDTQIQADVLSSFYNVESRYSNRFLANVVFFLYCLGFVLISIPGFFFTVQVLIYIFF